MKWIKQPLQVPWILIFKELWVFLKLEPAAYILLITHLSMFICK